MKLATVVLCALSIATVFANVPNRNRRGLPGVLLKDPNPITFTNFRQQYFYPRPNWGGYGGNFGNAYGISSYGVGTFGGWNHGGNYGSNYVASSYAAGTYPNVASSNSGFAASAYG
ncbi:uncharacterized protein LOC130701331 [Daphnia carinata]|uniref:uncharacterized protein LOC130701331 n=1 Tax=Daphnia carinata TaxID=120202 RepID=UPI00257B8227|nr:uncharacterized protein LOC130701331 [Daphnia carinata]